MQQNLVNEEQLTALQVVTFLVGNAEKFANIGSVPPLAPFHDKTVDFLNALSRNLMADREAKAYPDVITFAFWIRKSSIMKLKERFVKGDGDIRFGRGTAFHIAPSNVPVNYAYSMAAGLITGNINIVRVPSKDFPQVEIINKAVIKALKTYEDMGTYIFMVRYGHNKEVNDIFSAIADTRIVWGGDNTITEIRKSALSPRAGEITFADRYSLAVINSDQYIKLEEKERLAESFYNDTYLTDQNACTSPRIVVWTGNRKNEAKKEFWEALHRLVRTKYEFQPIMSVNKLTSSYLMAAAHDGVKIETHEDNYIIRVRLDDLDESIMEFKDNCGYFFEYDCDNLLELKELCNNTRCQTIGYLGDREDIMPLLVSGIKGVDRVVPIGKTMDFNLIWDGYNLYERLTRIINMVI